MKRVWLREYEILLSSNRREKPNITTITSITNTNNNSNNSKNNSNNNSNNNKLKQKKKEKKKEKKNKINENELANDILVLSMKGEYHRTGPELIEKKYGTMKLLYPSNSSNLKSSFQQINTLEEYQNYENKKELFLKTGNEVIFHEIYPPISPHIPSFNNNNNNKNNNNSDNSDNNKNSLQNNTLENTYIHDMNKLYHLNTLNNNNNNNNNNTNSLNKRRPKSSPSPGYRNKTSNFLVETLLKSSNDDLLINQSDLEVPPAPIDVEVAEKAENVWEGLINEVWHNGQCILYGDLTTFATTWQKNSTTRSIVKYLCVLFGLKTTPASDLVLAAERSLFRELVPLLKYLREVNPLTVPRRRLIKAQTIYQKYFQSLKDEHNLQMTDSESRLHISQIEHKFLRWVNSFQQVLNVIIHASVHQTILENDAINDAEETIERLRQKQLIAELKETEAAHAASKLTHIKKKKIDNKKLQEKLAQNESNLNQKHQNNNNNNNNNNNSKKKSLSKQNVNSTSFYSTETGLESNSLPTVAIMSLTGIIPVDDILSREEKNIKKNRLDDVQEETCKGLPPVIPGYGPIKSGKEYFDDEEENDVKNDLLGASLSSISQGVDSTSIPPLVIDTT